jgi:mRNA interferase MazF
MKRGEIYLCDLAEPAGHEAGFTRPVLLLSDVKLARAGLAIVVAITSRPRGYPTHVELDGVLPVTSYIQCEHVRTVSTGRLGKRLGAAGPAVMARVDTTLRRLTGL